MGGLDTKFGNCRCEIVGRRVIFIWSLIHESSWSGLIKVESWLCIYYTYRCQISRICYIWELRSIRVGNNTVIKVRLRNSGDTASVIPMGTHNGVRSKTTVTCLSTEHITFCRSNSALTLREGCYDLRAQMLWLLFRRWRLEWNLEGAKLFFYKSLRLDLIGWIWKEIHW